MLEVLTAENWFGEDVFSLRLFDQVLHARAGNLRCRIPQQTFNDVLVGRIDQRIGDFFGDIATDRDRQLVLERAVFDYLDKIVIIENAAFGQDWIGDFDLVVGENPDKVAQSVFQLRQAKTDGPPDDYFRFVHQPAQNIEHQLTFVLAGLRVGRLGGFRDRFDQRAARRCRPVSRECDEEFALELSLLLKFYRAGIAH